MNWWDLGEWSGYEGTELSTYRIACAFCGEKGNFETIEHRARNSRGDHCRRWQPVGEALGQQIAVDVVHARGP